MATIRKRVKTVDYDVGKFQSFVGDPKLGLAIEALKRANDVFDIIKPQETQHSEMLQWLLNPREGHGQGDALFKDFLNAAWSSKAESGLNAAFFAHWTPTRISMTGFHSVVLMREYKISPGNQLDFFIFDPVNRFVIAVENKYKALHDNGQLSRYRASVQQLVRRHPGFEGFQVALVALDRGRSRSRQTGEMKKNWVYLDYSWLNAGASRAEQQLKRGSQSASLLISYCQRQSDFVSEAEKDVDTLLGGLTREYRTLLKPLAIAQATRLGTNQGLAVGDPASDLWLFAQHHPELVQRLTRLKNLSFVGTEFRAAIPGAKFECAIGDMWAEILDESWYEYAETDDYYWPFYLRLRVVPPTLVSDDESTSTETRYRVNISYREGYVRKGKAERVHAAMVEAFPELAKGKQTAAIRRLMIDEVLESNLISELQRRYWKLSAVLQAV